MNIGGGNASFQVTNGQLQVTGGAEGQATSIAIQNGQLELGSVVAALQKEGFPEDVILEHLDSIVAEIEGQIKLELKGKEAYKNYLSDKYEAAPVAGPQETSVAEDTDEVTGKLLELFAKEGEYVNPAKLESVNTSDPKFKESVEALNNMIANPGNEEFSADFYNRFNAYMQQYPHGDVMASLFLVFKESIEQTNLDKRYFLERLAEMNKIAEAIGDYLETLTGLSNDLQKDIRKESKDNKDYRDGSTTVDVTVMRFDINSVGSEGEALSWEKETIPMNSTDLSMEIKNVETTMEEVRNKRQEFTTAFENFDQKANQLFNMLSTVLKNTKEMQMGITRNLL